MAMRIPIVAGVFAFRQSIALDGLRFILSLRWDGRTRAWYVGLADEPTGVQVVAGARLSPAWPIGLTSRGRGGPGGVLVALPTTDADVSLDATTLGDGWALFYLTKAETEAALSAPTADGLRIVAVP